jgi:hypothetical protein
MYSAVGRVLTLSQCASSVGNLQVLQVQTACVSRDLGCWCLLGGVADLWLLEIRIVLTEYSTASIFFHMWKNIICIFSCMKKYDRHSVVDCLWLSIFCFEYLKFPTSMLYHGKFVMSFAHLLILMYLNLYNVIVYLLCTWICTVSLNVIVCLFLHPFYRISDGGRYKLWLQECIVFSALVYASICFDFMNIQK